ncbi:hypothetical protein [Clostridium pasteurianum]|uniref:Uncharacterized protein n=1 Tax=Clostridium pasteurianum BC1 TaxID=86416 RepID=R4K241_CLOPA|nr:hypothetical protein [Clostridium pasteurianum]AGK95831.1 hypothetical protein Clopa_0802 [Clostridium pasteurianum BC1]
MKNQKTRCSECLYSINRVTQEPCSKCNEIQLIQYNYDNHFIPSEKNFMGSELNVV